jgi:hypothetical protein
MKKLLLSVGLLTGLFIAAHAQVLGGGGSGGGGAACSFANPTATIGATVVNGSALTCMRSDASPPLPSILPALDGSLLTTLNASALSSGTVPSARGGAGTVSGILKANGSGTVSVATSGTDYAPATSGSSILYGNGSGGFSPVTIGSGLNFSGGTLSNTGGGGGSVSVTASTPGIVVNPSPGTGTFTVGLTNPLNEQVGTTYTVLSTDGGKLVSTNNASNIAVSLPQASSAFGPGFGYNTYNYGGGLQTITPVTSTIAGKSTLTLGLQQGASIFSNGASNYGVILGLPQVAADSFLLNATGSTNYPTQYTFPSCSGATNALTYNTTTHAVGCNTISGGGGGTNTYTSTFSGNTFGTPGTTGLGVVLASATFNDSATAASGTAALFSIHSVAIPTITATNTAVTTTHASTFRLAGPPTCSTHETCTSVSTLSTASGNIVFEGSPDIRSYDVGGPGQVNTSFFSIGYTRIPGFLTFGTDSTGSGTPKDIYLYPGGSASLYFFTAGTQRMSISGAGGIDVYTGVNMHNAVITTQGYTVATLPTGVSTGARAHVTDATSCTFMGALTGGGSTKCPVFYNGTSWVAG